MSSVKELLDTCGTRCVVIDNKNQILGRNRDGSVWVEPVTCRSFLLIIANEKYLVSTPGKMLLFTWSSHGFANKYRREHPNLGYKPNFTSAGNPPYKTVSIENYSFLVKKARMEEKLDRI